MLDLWIIKSKIRDLSKKQSPLRAPRGLNEVYREECSFQTRNKMCYDFICHSKRKCVLNFNFLLPFAGFIMVSCYVWTSAYLSLPPISTQVKSEIETSSTKLDSDLDVGGREEKKGAKKILIWNTYWKSKVLWNKVLGKIIHGECPVSNCVFTLDKRELETSGAVLFHIVDLLHYHFLLPRHRPPWKQVWIGMTYEPPFILTRTGLDLSTLNGLFNRTMSYRRDSDIVIRHGTFHRINDHTNVLTSLRASTKTSALDGSVSNWVNSRDDPQTRNYAIGKRRLVAWFASSRGCKSQSGREKYVQELRRHIDVDVYGACGKFKCGEQKTMRKPYKVEHDDCYFLVSVAYKFILAFENSVCEDYVTEKLYNNLKLNVIPIVFGGGNYSFYAPPNSVIDASVYSPEGLASYLQLLDSNDTLYNEYFRWKTEFTITAQDGVPDPCELCKNLNEPAIYTPNTYMEFDQWLTSGCREGYGRVE